MVATVRCEEIASDKLRRLTSDECWLALEEAAQSGPVPGFGKKLSSILDTYLFEYDMEAFYFDKLVRKAKRTVRVKSVAALINHQQAQTFCATVPSVDKKDDACQKDKEWRKQSPREKGVIYANKGKENASLVIGHI